MAVRDHSWKSVIRGHRVYKAIWMPDIGEILDVDKKEVIQKIYMLLA